MDKILARLKTMQNLSENKEIQELCDILLDHFENVTKDQIGFKAEKK